MGREVRRVPCNWQHPKNDHGHYVPLYDGYAKSLADFEDMAKKEGLQATLDYYGVAPNRDNYMPEWGESEKTHWMMYETCTEGTPISPAFDTPEALAHWLADNNASAFGSETASYKQWLAMIRIGYAPSMVLSREGLRSGVADSAQEDGK